MKRVAVAGASGYAGGELLRVLSKHPEFEVTTVTGHSSAGSSLLSQQPHLRSLAHLTLQPTTAAVLSNHDVVFCALPHGASGALTAELKNVELVVDCGADHRLLKAGDWADYYGGAFYEPWAYGVPELALATGGKQRERLRQATKIAAPGCNASTVALSLAPGVQAGLIETTDMVSALAVAPSGAGKAPKVEFLAAEMLGSATPYAVGGSHRHIPEILQALAGADPTVPAAAHADPQMQYSSGYGTLSFTPMLVPMSRGILATSTARLRPGVTLEDVRAAWENSYAAEPFVHVLPHGVQPRTADTVGSNCLLLGVTVDNRAQRVVVTAALDNLVKGTAGAAVQCANIACGLPETLGLETDGVAP